MTDYDSYVMPLFYSMCKMSNSYIRIPVLMILLQLFLGIWLAFFRMLPKRLILKWKIVQFSSGGYLWQKTHNSPTLVFIVYTLWAFWREACLVVKGHIPMFCTAFISQALWAEWIVILKFFENCILYLNKYTLTIFFFL